MDPSPDGPIVEIVNGASGSRIDVLVHGTLDTQRWRHLETRLLRMVQVRQPAELRLCVEPAQRGDWSPARLATLEVALDQFGGRLVVDADAAVMLRSGREAADASS